MSASTCRSKRRPSQLSWELGWSQYPTTQIGSIPCARVAGETAKLGRVWPHMLRHSSGYYSADQGTDLRTMQDYLGHRDPENTAHYTRVVGHRFEGLWQ